VKVILGLLSLLSVALLVTGFTYAPVTRTVTERHFQVIEVVKEVSVETIKEVPVYIDRSVPEIHYQYRDWQVLNSIQDLPVTKIANLKPQDCLWIAQLLQ